MTTKREPQCTTYAQLHEHMARVYKMREGASVTVSSCVRKNGGPPTRWNNPTLWSDHPVFDGKPEEFEFALGIVERRPVFRGDVLFCNGQQYTIESSIAYDGSKFGISLQWHSQEYLILGHPIEDWTWNPPRRTIKIGDVEVPAPNNTPTWEYPENLLRIGERTFYFDKLKDRITTENAIIAAFEEKKP